MEDGRRALVHVAGCVPREVAPVEEECARVVVLPKRLSSVCLQVLTMSSSYSSEVYERSQIEGRRRVKRQRGVSTTLAINCEREPWLSDREDQALWIAIQSALLRAIAISEFSSGTWTLQLIANTT